MPELKCSSKKHKGNPVELGIFFGCNNKSINNKTSFLFKWMNLTTILGVCSSNYTIKNVKHIVGEMFREFCLFVKNPLSAVSTHIYNLRLQESHASFLSTNSPHTRTQIFPDIHITNTQYKSLKNVKLKDSDRVKAYVMQGNISVISQRNNGMSFSLERI